MRTSGIAVTNIVESGGQISFDIAFSTAKKFIVWWGDVDGDGVIGQADVNAVYGCLLSASCASVPALNHGDVDADAKITLRDALILHSYVVGGISVGQFRIGPPIHGPAPAVTVPITGPAGAGKPAIVVGPVTP